MINVNAMPCSECQHFKGIKQPDGTEKTEFVYCEVAKSNLASNLLKLSGRKLTCTKQLPYED